MISRLVAVSALAIGLVSRGVLAQESGSGSPAAPSSHDTDPATRLSDPSGHQGSQGSRVAQGDQEQESKLSASDRRFIDAAARANEQCAQETLPVLLEHERLVNDIRNDISAPASGNAQPSQPTTKSGTPPRQGDSQTPQGDSQNPQGGLDASKNPQSPQPPATNEKKRRIDLEDEPEVEE
jgi:hypothetical protein